MPDNHAHPLDYKTDSRTVLILSALFVAFVTFLVYIPALGNDFVNWDDPSYVLENLNIRSLDLGLIRWAFTTTELSNWHPLTLISHAVDYSIWGLDPFGYHLTNVVLHCLNTFFVFLLAHRLVVIGGGGHRRMMGLVAALVTAFLFAVHPLHVESVAWIAERTDLLYSLFFLLSLILYLGYGVRRGGGGKERGVYALYGASFLFFALSIMSKPMAVTLPVVLLIFDFYPLRRLGPEGGGGAAAGTGGLLRLVIEKTPFIIFSAFSSAMTILAQRASGALKPLESFPLDDRILNAAHSTVFYLYKMVVPLKLAPLYPYPESTELFSLRYGGALLLFLALTIAALLTLKRTRLLAALWAYYLIILLPVIGLVQAGFQSAADRFTYMSSLAPFLLAGLGLAYLVRHFRSRVAVAMATVFLALLVGLLSSLTIRQTAVWKDSFILWSHEIGLYPRGTVIAYVNRGAVYEERGQFDLALADYTTANELRPDYADIYVGRGIVYYKINEIEKAIGEFQKAIEIIPEYAIAHISLGVIHSNRGEFRRAIERFTTAVEIDNENVEAYLHRGIAFVDMGKPERGLMDLDRAIELEPRKAESYNARALAFYKLSIFERAEEDYLTAIEKDPSYAEAYFNLGLLYSALGDRARARENYEEARGLGLKEAREVLRAIP